MQRRRFQAYVHRRRIATQRFFFVTHSQLFPPTSCAKNMDETEDYHFLGGDLSALERPRVERKLSNVTSGLRILDHGAFSHHFKEGHKLSQSNLCLPAACGYFVSACRYRDLPYDCKPFCNWEVHCMQNHCASMQCYCTIPSSEVHTSYTISTRNSGKDCVYCFLLLVVIIIYTCNHGTPLEGIMLPRISDIEPNEV